MRTSFWVFRIVAATTFALLTQLSAGAKPSEDAGAAFSYKLAQPAFVTLVIEKEDGTRIRNLLACAKREAGENSETWDGLDDIGLPAPVGKYRWRGLMHDEISSHFQAAFNSPGNPPWNAIDIPNGWNLRSAGSGGWLSDHAAPQCVYAAEGKIFVGSSLAEAGNSLMELDLEGVKKWGTLWFSTSCADAVATDEGIIYVAGEKHWMGDKLKVHRLALATHKFVPNPPEWGKVKRQDAAFVDEISKNFSGIRGLVITPEYLVLALTDKGRLALFDKKTADFVKDIPLPEVGGICKGTQGTLFAISGKSVVKVDLDSGKLLPVVSSDLVAPCQVAVDAGGAGNFYVSDAAASEQCVKVFAPDGKFLRTIGEKGGRHEGKYDPRVMGNPAGLAVDSAGKLWVAENEFLPKRISVWSTKGELLKEFIGPPYYGGGGSLDPHNAK
ncbi:MAG: FlgD immunoglobulin-like domain containing protein, partial [Phycisphaerae bacterium]